MNDMDQYMYRRMQIVPSWDGSMFEGLNLRKLKEKFPIYSDHGFMDSVNVSSGVVADRVLILDQGMIMAAIANAWPTTRCGRLHRSTKRARSSGP